MTEGEALTDVLCRAFVLKLPHN